MTVYCPECGAPMKVVEPHEDDDWPRFYGCTQYPDCRGTREIDPETGAAVGDDPVRASPREEIDESLEQEDWDPW
jgi:ssDNA-binding Zn-finger/Zn-ribbon topoisomerase 1